MSIVQQYLMGDTRDEELIYWCAVDSIFHRISLYLRKLFLTIDFSLSQECELGLAIKKLQAMLKQPKNILVYDSCLADYIPKKLIPYLVDEKQNALHWNRFEFFFYKTVSSAIKSKKIFLTHSLHYKPL